MERVNSGAKGAKKKDKNYEIRAKIRQRNRDTRETLMILTEGDVTQYEALRRLTVEDYITKLEHFAGVTEAERNALDKMKHKK